MSDYSAHVVIDNGTYSIKAGFNGENAPRTVLPTIVGKLKPRMLNLIEDREKLYIGREAQYTSHLDYTFPIKNGIIDAEKMEPLWSHIFSKGLCVKPEAHNVFLTESINSSNKEREKIAEIMFEKFSIFNLHIEPQQVASLYSTTKTTGLIVESGESMTHIVPIYEGYIIPQGIKSIPSAGAYVTQNFMEYERDKLLKHNVGNSNEICRKIKEEHAELALDEQLIKRLNLQDDFNLNRLSINDSKTKENEIGDKQFELPDGNKILIGKERYLAPESIFTPLGESQPLHNIIYESVENVDVFLRKDFLSNIVLGGGNTMIKYFPERLKNELVSLYKSTSTQKEEFISGIKINAQSERMYSSWIGASVICSINNFQQMWISKNDYEEIGPSVVHKKYLY